MNTSLKATTSVVFKAPASRVWVALTDPKEIKKYLFGTEAVSDWKEGSPLIFKGTWEGKSYEDKGKILQIEKEKVLRYTYWSGFSGKPDLPENYNILTFELEPQNETTKLSITQENATSKESLDHSMKNWGTVLQSMKKLIES
jgi:uncharacterized protein YndB with AHSA1/START domain